jgi:ABC-2 type transport system permease protein
MHPHLVCTWAFALRNLLMASRNVFFVFELTFWPTVSVLSIGLMTRFLDLSVADTSFVLVGTLALAVVQVCQLDVAYVVLFDVWSKSMKHQFLAPIGVGHMTVGSWLVGILRGLVVFALLSAVSRWAFGFDVLAGGIMPLAAFLLGCFLMALIVGVLVCALVMLFGTRAETSAWASVNLVLLLSGIYYPISMLPASVASVATAIPLTYTLEAFRAHYGFASHFDGAVLRGLGLGAAYVGLAHWALHAAVRRTRRSGLLLKMSD